MSQQVNEAKIESYMRAAAWMRFVNARDEIAEALRLLDEKVQPKNKALPFQLLAVRRYLRIGDKRLDANWSWTDSEVARQYGREPTRTLYYEAAKVQENFRKANPGYHLQLTPVRSLERQIGLWMDNSSVQIAGAKLMKDMDDELRGPEYPDVSGGPAVIKFAERLRTAVVQPEPTNAAPGTSDHGRGTAVDFIVMKGQVKVAQTLKRQIRSVWDSQGWSAKLAAAVVGTRLKGPLKTPYEPWHWSL